MVSAHECHLLYKCTSSEYYRTKDNQCGEWPCICSSGGPGSSAMVGGLDQYNFLGKVTHFSGLLCKAEGFFSLYPSLTFVSDSEDALALPTPDFDLATPFAQDPCQNETLLGYLGNRYNILCLGPLDIQLPK